MLINYKFSLSLKFKTPKISISNVDFNVSRFDSLGLESSRSYLYLTKIQLIL